MNTRHSAAIILAAGLSSRSSSFKPLLPLGEETIVDHVISVFQVNHIDVFLVVGHRRDEVNAAVRDRDICIIENPDYERGMLTSVQAGARALDSRYHSFFVMPVDIPLVRPATIGRLLNEAEKHPSKIIYPVFNKRRGHPPLIPSDLIPSILDWNKEGGLKAALSANSSREVVVPDGNILFDVDTPDDHRELLHRFQRIHIPTDAECEAILDDICRVSRDIRRHSLTVAEVAVRIAEALNKSAHKVDVDAVRSAATLHDIAKGNPEHDAAGGRILHNLGFGLIGDIVAVHTDLGDADGEYSIEAKIVYLADKCADGTKLVDIESRYQSAGNKYAVTPEIESNIARRRERALRVKREIELILGCTLEKIIFE